MDGPRLSRDCRAIVARLSRDCRPRLSAGYNVDISVESTNDLPLLADFIAGNLLLIVQEAIHNAIKHARPKHICVILASIDNGKRFSLTIQDYGQGFVLGSQPGANAGHFGLIGMRERAERLSGSLEVRSEPEKGTRIIAHVPLLEFDPDLA